MPEALVDFTDLSAFSEVRHTGLPGRAASRRGGRNGQGAWEAGIPYTPRNLHAVSLSLELLLQGPVGAHSRMRTPIGPSAVHLGRGNTAGAGHRG